MTGRSVAARMADVRRIIGAGRTVYAERTRWSQAIAAYTGLSPEGVELGFSCLERSVSDAELQALVSGTPETERVHVVLSANVFVAPLRAMAIARAAASEVTVRPSPRDPTLTMALLEAAGDASITVTEDRDVSTIESGEVHVYGRDETIAAIRERAAPSIVVRGHGAGLGIAVVTGLADVAEAAAAIAADVVPFDQRGCLSPRIVFALGGESQGQAIALALHEELKAWSLRVPRGVLSREELAERRRWMDTLTFAGTVHAGAEHAVAFAPSDQPLVLPPPGRHALVSAFSSDERAAEKLAPLARYVAIVATDNQARAQKLAPPAVRICSLGQMQRPPLDGPVDRRP